jgi:hypothetical protein
MTSAMITMFVLNLSSLYQSTTTHQYKAALPDYEGTAISASLSLADRVQEVVPITCKKSNTPLVSVSIAVCVPAPLEGVDAPT